MPGSFGHLVSRFFDYLGAGPLTSDEQHAVESWLSPEETKIFFDQSAKDQAHGYHAALVVRAADNGSPEVLRAALLHDIGKRHSRLGVVGRSAASVLIKMRGPLTRRMAMYRDHGSIGAAELAEAGSPPIVVEFARYHHESRPAVVSAPDWELLLIADVPAKARLGRSRR